MIPRYSQKTEKVHDYHIHKYWSLSIRGLAENLQETLSETYKNQGDEQNKCSLCLVLVNVYYTLLGE